MLALLHVLEGAVDIGDGILGIALDGLAAGADGDVAALFEAVLARIGQHCRRTDRQQSNPDA